MRDDLHLGDGNARLPWKKMKTFMVEGTIDSKNEKQSKFKDGKGYLGKDGQVWIYYDTPPKTTGTIPWFSMVDGKLVFAKDVIDEVLDEFNEKNIRDISLETIEKETKENEELYNEEELKFLNAATSVYTPEIKEEDDFLKKVVKKLLLVLQININRFAPTFQYKYELTNMRTALQNQTKTSTKVFSKWMELLNSDFTIIVKTKDGADPSMDGFIVYNSKDNSIRYVDEIHKDDII